ncbi:hypothetical protein U1Q18_032159 [Sarracenia purpurea var. burkii]
MNWKNDQEREKTDQEKTMEKDQEGSFGVVGSRGIAIWVGREERDEDDEEERDLHSTTAMTVERDLDNDGELDDDDG